MAEALIFDCDGVLSDTERDGHLPAFNATFAHFGLPVRWSQSDYEKVLAIGGGKERLATLFEGGLGDAQGLPTDADGRRALVAQWHRDKTDRYTALIRSGALPARPGIVRLVTAAAEAGWKLAVASTSAEASVRAVLEHAIGEDLAAAFAVFAGDAVPAKKPAPDIYLLALRGLGVSPEQSIVVEDSANGLRAALAAGLTTVITRSSYTTDEDFTGAALVVDSLGDLPSVPATVVSGPAGVVSTGEVTLDDLRALRSSATTSNPLRRRA